MNERRRYPMVWKRSLVQYLVAVGWVAIAYFLSAKVAFSLLQLKAPASPVCFSAGIALAALLLKGCQLWVGVALGAFFFAKSLGVPEILVWGAALGSALEAVIGQFLLRRLGFQPQLRRLQDVLLLVVFGAGIPPIVAATIRTVLAGGRGVISEGDWGEFWGMFWLGDGMGVLVVTPLILVVSRVSWYRVKFPTLKSLELWLLLSLLTAIAFVVFAYPKTIAIAQCPLEYLPFPFLVWAALRFGQLGAVTAIGIVSSIAIVGAMGGGGPFVAKVENISQAIFFLQAFLSIVTMTTLAIAAAATERMDVETLLQERETSLKNAQRIAQLGNWELNFQTQQLWWSDEMYRLLGFSPKAFPPSWEVFLETVHGEDREAVRLALQVGQPYSLNYRIVLPSGVQRKVCECLEISDRGMTGTVQDVTERCKAEEQLERLVQERTQELQLKYRELQDLNHFKDVFLQAVSHDLRTSLLGMSMVLKNLQSSGATTLSCSILERLICSSDRQLNLINSLLEEQFTEKCNLTLTYQSLHLPTFLQQMIQDWEPKLAQNEASLSYEIPEALSLIRADPSELKRVFDHLFTNAIKHNPPGLSLTLTVIEDTNDPMICCVFKDNGVGMSSEQCASLFKLYIRGLHTPHLTGIGLGSYICKQIINAHGGEIKVSSTLGEGTTFWFTLPKVTDKLIS